ncbi:MAG: hypothetical protein IPJ77_04215 [Planctomycetes bacterium]|nr:hypothetical protein [Planctomycetota bacterium]
MTKHATTRAAEHVGSRVGANARRRLALVGVAALVLVAGTPPWTAPSLWGARIER